MPTASLKAKYLSQKLLLMKKVRNVLSATAFILQNSLSKIFLQKALYILKFYINNFIIPITHVH